jgi:hypothetical protein
VVAADKVDPMWVTQLQAYEKRYCFDRKETTVDVVTWGELAFDAPVGRRVYGLLTYLGTGNWYQDRVHQS